MSELSDIQRDELKVLVRQAGEELLSYWQPSDQTGSYLEITAKPDGTSVTNADLASNSILIAGLEELFPEDKILSEEIEPDQEIDSARRVWVIDPLDGTQSFIEGRNDFSVLLALTVDQRPVFGIEFFPAQGIFCDAYEGVGSFQNGERIRTSSDTTLSKEKTYIRGFTPKATEIKFPERMDSGLAFQKIARGDFDGSIIKLGRLKQWDLAAPAALIEHAGGRISDENGNPILFTAHSFNYRYFIASNGHCHDKLLQHVPKE